MSELQFAKQFLNNLDNKTTKYQPDHAFDPKTTQLRIPYTLPKLSHPPHPEPPKNIDQPPPPPGAEPAESVPNVTLTLKSNRNPNMSLTLQSLPYTATISSVKESIQSHLGGPTVLSSLDKVKILLNKKPIPSSKQTIADAFKESDVEGKEDVTLSVMIMGGAPDPPSGPAEIPPPSATGDEVPAAAIAASAPGSEKAQAEAEKMEGVEKQQQPTEVAGWQDEVSKREFWDDLQGFLQQRLKDQEGGKKLRDVIEKAWRADVVRIAT